MIGMHYSSDHSWVRVDDDGRATVGISDYAQAQLGDVVFVELPEIGRTVAEGEDIGIIESVKTTGEFKAPVVGTVVAHNPAVLEQPELVNESPLDDGWLIRIALDDEGALAELMDEDAYTEYVDTLD